MNVVAGWLLLVILFMAGAPIERTSDIDAKYIYDPHLLITEVLENSPAQAAGLEIGDRIISADSNQFTDIDPFQEFTDSKQGQESIIVYERAKEQYTANITPEIMQDIDENRHIIGVGLSESGTVRFPVHKAIVAGTTSTIGYIQRIAVAFANIISGLFKGQGAGSVGGPVAIAVTTNDVLDLGFSHVIIFTAVLSFNLAIINILPFPALDGGRLIFLFAEKIRGKKGRREIEAWFHRIGFVLLMLLAIVITYRDIVRFGGRIWKAVIG
jgi:regulator of sigma E protease